MEGREVTEFILLLSLWPFHHKKPIASDPSAEGPTDVVSMGDAEGECTKQGDLYFYVAADGVIAFSRAGCDAAKSNIETARTLNQVRMSRS